MLFHNLVTHSHRKAVENGQGCRLQRIDCMKNINFQQIQSSTQENIIHLDRDHRQLHRHS